MARKNRSGAFGAPTRATGNVPPARKPAATPSSQQGIPEVVANRMARRIAITTGIPTLLGIAVFVASYLLVSRQILDIPPGVTLLGSGACFLLGLLGLSYGVFSSSWENAPGTLLGAEQIVLNLGRLRAAISGSPKRGA